MIESGRSRRRLISCGRTGERPKPIRTQAGRMHWRELIWRIGAWSP